MPATDAAGRRSYDDDPSGPDASHEFGFFRPEDAIGNVVGKLPHWRQEGVTYFVTFRLADSLPQTKLREWLQEREAWLAVHPKPWDDDTNRAYHRQFTARIGKRLDAGYGSCVLARQEIRSIVADALRHFDGMRYGLGAWIVMMNHVHAIVRPLACNLYPLEKILQSWKQFTAKRILRQSGVGVSLWQEESFDRIVRDEEHLYRCVQYIGSNPARAKLAKGASLRWIRPEWESLGCEFAPT
jgi:type I restriction enzyme R subunit